MQPVEKWHMKSKMRIHVRGWKAHRALPVTVLATIFAAMPIATLAGAQAPSRFLGTITAISGTTLTVKTDAGVLRQVNVPSTAALKRIEPGAKDLSAAAAMSSAIWTAETGCW